MAINNEIRLTENAKKVLEKRYLLKNDKGEVIETPKDLFRRVAKNIAKADKLYEKKSSLQNIEEEFYGIMADLEFLPNSPTLMNAGRELQQLSACFTKEQKILLNPGYKTIDQVKIGDKVVTHKERTKRVTELYKRRYNGDIYIVNVRGLIKPTLHITEEHPILAIKKEDLACNRINKEICNGSIKKYCLKTPLEYRKDCEFINQYFIPEWLPIKQLKKGDYVVVNTNKEIRDVKEIEIENYINNNNYLKKGKYLVARERPNEGKKIPNKIKIDKDFLKLIGYWLADGSVSKRYDKYAVIRFTFNIKETEFCREIKEIMKKKFNLMAKEEFTEKQKTIQLRFNSVIVSELFYKLFGSGFSGKRLPHWIFILPPEKQISLIIGLFRGDGCYSKRKKQDTIFVSLSNERLAIDIWNILLRLGYNFNINHRKPKIGTREAFRISASPSECKELVKAINKGEYRERKIFPQYVKDNDITLRPIDKIERKLFDGDVYNLEVEDDNSYLANGVAAHNCFVLPIEDSMDSIFETIKDMAMIQKSGGGTGFSFSRLRPKNSTVKTTGGVASGPISFLKVFNGATEAVKQGGTRRGANMGILRIDHPDILEFIKCKENDKEITNFNISVALTEDFMKKVIADEDYDLIDPHSKKHVKKFNAREVFDLIVKMAWKNGEPGVIFLDRMNKFNPTPELGEYESTNPCGEQILLPYESCNLGSINLFKMVDEKNKKIDWDKLTRTVKTAVHFLDNVIDMNKYPLKKIKDITKANRKIGLGVMGFADMLIKLGVKYNSEEGLATARKVMEFILNKAREASRNLARKRGAFPNFERSIYRRSKEEPLRNATLTTIAPTGSLSIIAGCSSGIEPLFAVSYVRKILDNERLIEVQPYFKEIAETRGFFSPELMKLIAEKGSIKEIDEIPQDVKELFVTSHDISAIWHIKMQGVFQEYTDNAVSKTVNFSQDATVDDVRDVYMLAHKLGCKGVTIYRDKSREEQVLNIENSLKKKIEVSKIIPRPRPVVTTGTTTKVATGCGNLYVTINEDEQHLPFEVFMQMGKAGGCAMSQLEAIGRLLSLALRSGIDIDSIIEQLKGIRCPNPSWEKGGRIFSCSDAIGRVIERRLVKAKEKKPPKQLPRGSAGKKTEPNLQSTATSISTKKKLGNIVGVCPDCGAALYQVEGCNVCNSCGYSTCG